MSKKAKPARDAFTFSLGGTSTITSFVVAPAIAHDRLNKVLEERPRQDQEDQPDSGREIASFWGRFWFFWRRPTA